jgi:hypothetical protein
VNEREGEVAGDRAQVRRRAGGAVRDGDGVQGAAYTHVTECRGPFSASNCSSKLNIQHLAMISRIIMNYAVFVR